MRVSLLIGLFTWLSFAGQLTWAEKLELPTDYPSPLGKYSALSISHQTSLARDGGSVGVGTANPAAGTLLHLQSVQARTRFTVGGLGAFDWRIFPLGGKALALSDGVRDVLVIGPNGKVGIGMAPTDLGLTIAADHVLFKGDVQTEINLNNSPMGCEWGPHGTDFTIHGGLAGGSWNSILLFDNGSFVFGSHPLPPWTPTHPIEFWKQDAVVPVRVAYLNDLGQWTKASTRRIKEQIETLSFAEAAATIEKLEPVTFRYKSSPDVPVVGFIAEDVPDNVSVPGRRGMASMDIVAVLTRVLQEDRRQLDELKKRLSAPR